MKIKIDGIGKLKDVEFDLDKISVIVGENNSGKSTIGKTITSIINSLRISQDKFFNEVKEIVLKEFPFDFARFNLFLSQSEKIEKNPSDTLNYFLNIKKATNIDEIETSLNNFEIFLNECLANSDKNIELEKYLILFRGLDKKQKKEKIIKELRENIEKAKKTIHDLTFEKYLQTTVYRTLSDAFNGQIYPVLQNINEANVSLDKANFNIKDESTIIEGNIGDSYFNSAYFIGDANVLDDLSQYRMFIQFSKFGLGEVRDSFNLETVLLDAIASNNSVIDEVIGKDTLKQLEDFTTSEFDNEEIVFREERYVTNKTGLDVRNLATGSKLSLILKQLIRNNKINEKTLIVIDEPESHLHPQWQESISELIVLIAAKLNAKIIITTHSINLLMGIILYSKKYGIGDKSNYYLIQKIGNYFCTLKNFTSDYNALIHNLGKAFIDLNNKFEKVLFEESEKHE